MLMLATNRAEDLDVVVLDCCDESLFFPLPNAECRKDLILLYYNLHFQKFMKTNNLQALSKRSHIIQYFTNQKPLLMKADDDLMTGKQLKSTVCALYVHLKLLRKQRLMKQCVLLRRDRSQNRNRMMVVVVLVRWLSA
jgi:hypothetical protein